MNRLRSQRSQRPPSSFSPLSGKSLLGRILCSLAACSLFSVFCRVLSANITGVDEFGPYFQPTPFYASLPLLLIFYFILRKSLFLFSVPREFPPLPPYDGSDGANRRAEATAFFSRFLCAWDPALDIAIFTLLFFLLSPGRIFPTAVMFRDYYFPFLPAAALLIPFLLMIFGIDTLSRYSAEKAIRFKQSMKNSDRSSSPSGDSPSDDEKTAETPPAVQDGVQDDVHDGPGVSWILGRCLLILIVWSVGGSLLLSVLVPLAYSFLLMLFRDGGNVLSRSALLTFVLLLAAAMLVLMPVIRLLRATVKRVTFLRRLRRIVEEKDRKDALSDKGTGTSALSAERTGMSAHPGADGSLYPRTKVKHPFLSLLFSVRGESFRMVCGGRIYACKLLCSRKKTVPIELSPEGIGKRIHRFRIRKVTVFTYHRFFRFGFSGEDCDGKLLIVLPTPKEIYRREKGRISSCDNGDRVGDYRIYTGSAFLNAFERECIDR